MEWFYGEIVEKKLRVREYWKTKGSQKSYEIIELANWTKKVKMNKI